MAAHGAAIASRETPCTFTPPPDPRRQRVVDRGTVLVAAALFAATVAGCLLAPVLHATRAAAVARAQLVAAHGSQVQAARVEGELRRASAQLEQVEQFRATRGAVTALFGELSAALPESSALVSLRLDTLEGSFVVLAARAARVLPALDSIDAIVGARIVGSVTRETHASARLDRATIRFRRARPTAAIRSTLAARGSR